MVGASAVGVSAASGRCADGAIAGGEGVPGEAGEAISVGEVTGPAEGVVLPASVAAVQEEPTVATGAESAGDVLAVDVAVAGSAHHAVRTGNDISGVAGEAGAVIWI